MEILKWAALSMFTTLIGAVAGFGFTTRRVVVIWYHIAGLFILTFIVSLASSFLGQMLSGIFSVRVLEVLVGLLIISTGAIITISKPIYPGNRELLLFGLVIQADVFLLSFHYGQTHQGGYGLAFTISLLLLVGIVGGMVFGGRRPSNWRLQIVFPFLSGIFLIVIGMIKVL